MLGPYYCQKYDLVFATDHGTFLDPKNLVARHFKKLIETHNQMIREKAKKKNISKENVDDKLIPVIRFHDLRHTYATLSLEAGTDLSIVSKNLGHSSYAITADTYSHMTDKIKDEAAEKICAVITDCLEKK